MSEITTNQQGGALRSLPELAADIKLHINIAGRSIIQVGLDLIEAKAQMQHGSWLPWLQHIGMSSSYADNYMRVAREYSPDSKLAALPVSKMLALLAVPADEREQFAEEHHVEDKSAAEIKRLTKELHDVHREYDETLVELENEQRNNEKLTNDIGSIRADNSSLRTMLDFEKKQRQDEKKEIERLNDVIFDMGEKREKMIVTRTVEVAPADYEQIKQRLAEAEDAAVEAEQRAADAERRAQAASMRAMDDEPAEDSAGFKASTLLGSVNRFLMEVQFFPQLTGEMAGMSDADRTRCLAFVQGVSVWCDRMRASLMGSAPVMADGMVSGDE